IKSVSSKEVSGYNTEIDKLRQAVALKDKEIAALSEELRINREGVRESEELLEKELLDYKASLDEIREEMKTKK
ncbi:MAG: hypothetical protein KKH80_00975, partial [Candidatus Omnitrophica bacterium]|nr:hypothetical protein [Candidatus Omnitrophota bacterium]